MPRRFYSLPIVRRLADADRSGAIGFAGAFVILRYHFAGEPLP